MELSVDIYECGKCESQTSIETYRVIKCCAVCGEDWDKGNMHISGTGTITDIVENE